VRTARVRAQKWRGYVLALWDPSENQPGVGHTRRIRGCFGVFFVCVCGCRKRGKWEKGEWIGGTRSPKSRCGTMMRRDESGREESGLEERSETSHVEGSFAKDLRA